MLKAIILSLTLLHALLFGQDSLKIQINKVLDEWHAAAARADMAAYFKTYRTILTVIRANSLHSCLFVFYYKHTY